MAKPKTKKTKSAIQVGPADDAAGLDNVPVGDQFKTTKKKGRPAKTKPIQEEVPDVPVTAAMEGDTQEAVGDEEEVSSTTGNMENKKPGPGTKSKQKRAGLVFPIVRMRQILKKGKKSRRV